MERNGGFGPVVVICVLILALGALAQAQYGGGSGEPNDPYLIYAPQQMNAIGADPNDWDKHFKLMADIDLAAYSGAQFNLIGSVFRTSRGDTRLEQAFTGIFDGDGHTISNFTYTGEDEGRIGLFRYIHGADAEVRNLGLITPTVDAGLRDGVGALVSYLEYATITNCYVEGGRVMGHNGVGGLIGSMRGIMGRGYFDPLDSDIRDCHSTCDVVGASSVGGLVGSCAGLIADCCSASTVTGEEKVGGLVGSGGAMTACHAEGIVQGSRYVGGLVGWGGSATNCYARGFVIGDEWVGGLAGGNSSLTNCYAIAVVLGGEGYTGGLMAYGEGNHVVASFWDLQASRQQSSVGGVGKTTSQMQTISTYRSWREGDSAGIWTIDEGNDYPRLAWEGRPGFLIAPLTLSDLAGTGMADDPYLIYRADEMELIANERNEWGKHFKLMADLDLSAYPGVDFNIAWGDDSYPFTGTFDGNGHTISNYTYVHEEDVGGGFFGYVHKAHCERRRDGEEVDCNSIVAPVIENLRLLDPVIDSMQGGGAAALVGILQEGTVRNCGVEGGFIIGPYAAMGGLVGYSHGTVIQCYAVGGTVIGGWEAGGLIGRNDGDIANCYCENDVLGTDEAEYSWYAEGVGGLVGSNTGGVTNCYSASAVAGKASVGGLVGYDSGEVVASFWDVETSGQDASPGGTGLTTAEMQTAATFLEAGWDFVEEVGNGQEDLWYLPEGDYPRLWWKGEF